MRKGQCVLNQIHFIQEGIYLSVASNCADVSLSNIHPSLSVASKHVPPVLK